VKQRLSGFYVVNVVTGLMRELTKDTRKQLQRKSKRGRTGQRATQKKDASMGNDMSPTAENNYYGICCGTCYVEAKMILLPKEAVTL
jgi:hypothetical protein